MKCAVIGLGEFGKALALKMAQRGAEVIAIDNNMDIVEDIKNEVSLAVKLDATDEKDLRSQGVDKADVLVAAMGVNFEANALVVVMAKKLGIPKIIARATNATHARILKLIGADEVIQPEENSAERLSHRLLFTALKSYFELIQGYSIVEIEISKKLSGKTILDVLPSKEYKINLIAIKKRKHTGPDLDAYEETINIVPKETDILEKGDIVTIAGSDKDIMRIMEEIDGN
ncbi:MAG: TrkA family potassium uptake protein [Planctomycetota bacterium]